MIKITVNDKDAGEIMEIVRQMRTSGLLQGKDFDFAYSPPGSSDDGWAPTPKYTVFIFYDEKLATLFSLKWM